MKSVRSQPRLPPPTHDQIAALAYAIWLDQGSLPGNEIDNWLEAERQLREGGPRRHPLAADSIPAEPGNTERDPAVDGGEMEAELERVVSPRTPRSPTSL